MVELSRVLPCYRKGLLSVFPSTVSLYRFRTRAELDRYLEASQIRQRAIERVTNVIGTYGSLPVALVSYLVIGLYAHITADLFLSIQCSNLLLIIFFHVSCRYNDLRLRIFSKYPDLFPEEVLVL